MFIFSNMAIRLVNQIQSEQELSWEPLMEDIVSFMAKNQFKEKLSKMAQKIAADDQKPMKKMNDYKMIRETADRLDCLLSGEAINTTSKF